MTDPGTCSNNGIRCSVGYSCPSYTDESVTCLPCSDKMTAGQRCVCKPGIEIVDCIQCSNGKCSACLPGTYLDVDYCPDCSKGCEVCIDKNTCTKCSKDYFLNETTNQCTSECTSNMACQFNGGGYCDKSTGKCIPCNADCEICSAANVCDTCKDSRNMASKEGLCIVTCEERGNGQYCDNDVVKQCEKDIKTSCRCGEAINCEMCSPEGTQCSTCLAEFMINEVGHCTDCGDGFERIETVCLPKQTDDGQVLRGGSIFGIIFSVLAVIGGLGIGIALFLIKRGKKVKPDVGVTNNLE
ncbi:Cysteine-rich membrane protein 1 [Spironucleus salmonicida]|uniref:Cysteine-rich membrane protein 1 n=1 Tax=Spironucleus salmonicida TaxID=348837 RepID=V6LQA9_9EUKA|nr:Cysteine-rich membrane protein 1 [Spironucleus salmonicida]|eukprot:EST46857.1 Cysteine-rich membrane protein 1 [Spironucleus salmonicida]